MIEYDDNFDKDEDDDFFRNYENILSFKWIEDENDDTDKGGILVYFKNNKSIFCFYKNE